MALDTSGIVLSLPIVNVKGTDLAVFNPRGMTELYCMILTTNAQAAAVGARLTSDCSRPST